MEEDELARARVKRERNDTAQRTMTPADVFRIFLIGILRIENDYVAVLQEFDNLRALGDGELTRFFFANPVARCELNLERFVQARCRGGMRPIRNW